MEHAYELHGTGESTFWRGSSWGGRCINASARPEQDIQIAVDRGVDREPREARAQRLRIRWVAQQRENRIGQGSIVADGDQRTDSAVVQNFAGATRAIGAHHRAAAS